MKTNKLWSIMVMLTLMLGTAVSLSSCGGDDDDMDNDKKPVQGQDNGNQTTGTSTLQNEASLRREIDEKVNVSASYEVGMMFDYNIKYNLSTSLVPEPGMVIKYGVEYGLDGYDYYNVFNVSEGSSSSTMNFSIIIPKEGEAETLFVEYQMFVGSLRACIDKSNGGGVLTSSERDLMSSLVKRLSETETYMKKHFISRAYVSINETKYYFYTAKFDYNGNLKQQKVNCYKE